MWSGGLILITAVVGFPWMVSPFGLQSLKRLASKRFLHESSPEPDSNMDALRKSLEDSWDLASMGSVPTNSYDAAAEAAACLSKALSGKIAKNPYTPNIFSIQLLLPSLDITSGPKIYDDVALVDFCVELSKVIQLNRCLEPWHIHRNVGDNCGQDIAIFVRDDTTARGIERVLTARGKLQLTPKNDDDSRLDIGTQFYDDFAETESSNIFQTESEPRETLAINRPSYRLTSLFKDYKISSGPDMTNDVVRAIASHEITEDLIIIVSPFSPADMLAVRKLIQDYANRKIIILVNEKMDPWPRELRSCEIVYSILPLIASPSDNRPFLKTNIVDSSKSRPMNIVLMRKAPHDWELFLDYSGEGFQLVGSTEANVMGKRGPSMEWIATKVKEFLNKRDYNPSS